MICFRPVDPYVCVRPVGPYVCVRPVDPYVCVGPVGPYVCVRPVGPYVCVRPVGPYVCVGPVGPYVCVGPVSTLSSRPAVGQTFTLGSSWTLSHWTNFKLCIVVVVLVERYLFLLYPFCDRDPFQGQGSIRNVKLKAVNFPTSSYWGEVLKKKAKKIILFE